MIAPDLRALARALGGEVRGGEVFAPGPGHSSKDRSLSIKLDPGTPDGFVVNSFAGDDAIQCKDYVREKAGMAPFEPKRNGNGRRRASEHDITKAMMAAVQAAPASEKIVATYDYQDDAGVLLYQVVRYEPKDFRQRRPNGKGSWISSVGDRRVLYRLPELLQFPDATVFVTEGEKDADRLAALEHCATTVASGKWTDVDVKALAGRDVIILEDNDEAGRKKANEAATALHGTAKTIRIVQLPGLPEKGDVSNWLDADAGNAEKLAEVCFAVPVWTPLPSLPWIDISNWDNEPAPRREWAVADRIPLKQPYLFTGHGAVGKSLIELMRACAHVLGKPWLGMPATQGPVIYMGAEDDKDELRRRLDDILGFYGASFADVNAGGLHLLSYAGEDCMLGVPDRSGIIQPTPLLGQLEEAAKDINSVAVIVDTVSDVFGGNENDRGHVTQFIKLLQGVALRANCSVSILAHPSNTGMATGSGISGSTGWHNKVRARAYMRTLETQKGEEPNPDLREIQFLKNNYGRQGDSIQVRWERGVYVLESAPNSLEKLAQDHHDDDRFLDLVKRYEGQGRKVSDRKSANNYAPKLFAEEKDKKVSVRRFELAMQRLFTAGKVHVHNYGRPSRPTYCIVLGPKP